MDRTEEVPRERVASFSLRSCPHVLSPMGLGPDSTESFCVPTTVRNRVPRAFAIGTGHTHPGFSGFAVNESQKRRTASKENETRLPQFSAKKLNPLVAVAVNKQRLISISPLKSNAHSEPLVGRGRAEGPRIQSRGRRRENGQ
jgi:hypothetical protein